MYHEIQAEKAVILARLQELEAQETDAREQAITALMEELQVEISDQGLADALQVVRVDNVTAENPPRSRRTKTEPQRRKPAVVYVHQETGNTYSRGAKPNWLKKMMSDVDLDPDSKDDFLHFRDTFLVRQAA